MESLFQGAAYAFQSTYLYKVRLKPASFKRDITAVSIHVPI